MQLVQNLLNLSIDTSEFSAITPLDAESLYAADEAFDFANVLRSNIGVQQADGDLLPLGGNLLPLATLNEANETGIRLTSSAAYGGTEWVIESLQSEGVSADNSLPAMFGDLTPPVNPLATTSGLAVQPPLQVASRDSGQQNLQQATNASAASQKASALLTPFASTAGSGGEQPLSIKQSSSNQDAANALRTVDPAITSVVDVTGKVADPMMARAATTVTKVPQNAGPPVSTVSGEGLSNASGLAEMDLAYEGLDQQRAAQNRVANGPLGGVELALDGNTRLPTPLTSSSAPISSGGVQFGLSSLTGDRAPVGAFDMPTSHIATPVRDSAWSDRISQHVMSMAAAKTRTAEVRLTPTELGPLRVQIDVDDGTANVAFQSQHAATRDALEVALPRLRELLAENGLSLGQANIGDRDQAQRDANASSEDAIGQSVGQDVDGDLDAAHENTIGQPRGRGLVDAFV